MLVLLSKKHSVWEHNLWKHLFPPGLNSRGSHKVLSTYQKEVKHYHPSPSSIRSYGLLFLLLLHCCWLILCPLPFSWKWEFQEIVTLHLTDQALLGKQDSKFTLQDWPTLKTKADTCFHLSFLLFTSLCCYHHGRQYFAFSERSQVAF